MKKLFHDMKGYIKILKSYLQNECNDFVFGPSQMMKILTRAKGFLFSWWTTSKSIFKFFFPLPPNQSEESILI